MPSATDGFNRFVFIAWLVGFLLQSGSRSRSFDARADEHCTPRARHGQSSRRIVLKVICRPLPLREYLGATYFCRPSFHEGFIFLRAGSGRSLGLEERVETSDLHEHPGRPPRATRLVVPKISLCRGNDDQVGFVIKRLVMISRTGKLATAVVPRLMISTSDRQRHANLARNADAARLRGSGKPFAADSPTMKIRAVFRAFGLVETILFVVSGVRFGKK